MICEGILALCLSQGVLVGSTVADFQSSRGLIEANLVLGRGQFGARQVIRGSLITGGVVILEHLAVRKWPKSKKVFTYVNFGVSAGHLGAAGHNFRQ